MKVANTAFDSVRSPLMKGVLLLVDGFRPYIFSNANDVLLFVWVLYLLALISVVLEWKPLTVPPLQQSSEVAEYFCHFLPAFFFFLELKNLSIE